MAVKVIARATYDLQNATPNLPYALRFICEFSVRGGGRHPEEGLVGGKENRGDAIV